MPQASGLQQKVGDNPYNLGQGFYAGNNLQYMGQAGSMLQPAAEMASSLLPEGHDIRAGSNMPFTGKADSSIQQSYKADSSNPYYLQQGRSDNVHALAGSNMQQMGQISHMGSMQHALAEAGISLQQMGQISHMGSMQHALGEAGSSLQQMGQISHMGSMQHALGEAGSSLQQMGQISHMGSMQHVLAETGSNMQQMGQKSHMGGMEHALAEAGSSMQQIGQKSHMGSMQHALAEAGSDMQQIGDKSHMDQNSTSGSYSEGQQTVSRAGSIIQLLGQNFQDQADSYTVQQQEQLGESGQAGSEWQKPGSHTGSTLQYEAESPLLGSKMKHQELSSCSIQQGFQGNSNQRNQEQSSFAGRAAGVVLQQQMGRNPFPNSSLEETERSSCDGGNKQRFEQGDTVHLFKQKNSSKIKGGQVTTDSLRTVFQFPPKRLRNIWFYPVIFRTSPDRSSVIVPQEVGTFVTRDADPHHFYVDPDSSHYCGSGSDFI